MHFIPLQVRWTETRDDSWITRTPEILNLHDVPSGKTHIRDCLYCKGDIPVNHACSECGWFTLGSSLAS